MQANEAKADPVPDGLAQILLTAMKLANRLSACDAFASHGLTVPEWLVLTAFPGDGAPTTLARLAVLTGLTATRVKVLMTNLESNGLVQATSAENGRPSRLFTVSDAGRVLAESIRTEISHMQESVSTPAQTAALVRASRLLGRFSRTLGQTRPAH